MILNEWAREIARQTNTPLVLMRDGVLVEEFVTDAGPADKETSFVAEE